MKILLIAMSESIHTARWISQMTDQGWDIQARVGHGVNSFHFVAKKR